jgi:hypothetical protein
MRVGCRYSLRPTVRRGEALPASAFPTGMETDSFRRFQSTGAGVVPSRSPCRSVLYAVGSAAVLDVFVVHSPALAQRGVSLPTFQHSRVSSRIGLSLGYSPSKSRPQ